MATLPLYTMSIIPPAAIFPYVRVLADRLALISPYIVVTDEPHLSVTGVLSGEERVAALVAELKEGLSDYNPFELPLGPPIRMSDGKFPENFALSIPAVPELIALSDIVADITLQHFPKLKKRGLFSFKDHIFLVQNIPEESRLAVAKEAHKIWKPLSIKVDRIWVVRRHAGKLTREPIFFKGRSKEEYTEQFIPDDDGERWMLAVMFARLQGTTTAVDRIEDYEGSNKATKINKVIDLGCRTLVVLEDGRAINQPKSTCTRKINAGYVAKELDSVVDTINETIYVKGDRPFFVELKEGAEVTL